MTEKQLTKKRWMFIKMNESIFDYDLTNNHV